MTALVLVFLCLLDGYDLTSEGHILLRLRDALTRWGTGLSRSCCLILSLSTFAAQCTSAGSGEIRLIMWKTEFSFFFFFFSFKVKFTVPSLWCHMMLEHGTFLSGSFRRYRREFQSWQTWWKRWIFLYHNEGELSVGETLAFSHYCFRFPISLHSDGTQQHLHRLWSLTFYQDWFLSDLLRVLRIARSDSLSVLATTVVDDTWMHFFLVCKIVNRNFLI